METNVVTNLSSVVNTLKAVVDQMHSWPLSIVLIICLTLAGGVLKLIFTVVKRFGHDIENKLSKKPGVVVVILSRAMVQLIPVMVVLGGIKLNLMITSTGEIAPCPYPEVPIMMYGFCLGIMAWLLHVLVVKPFEKRVPLLAGKPENGNGDTDTIEKPKE